MTTTKPETRTEPIVQLPPGHISCNVCGVATPGRARSATLADGHPAYISHDAPEALCDSCAVTRAEANAIVRSRPRLSARYGSLVNQRVESLLHVYKILGIAEDGEDGGSRHKADLETALVAYTEVLNLVHWLTPDRKAARYDYRNGTGLCASEPFAFLTDEQRTAIKEARREEIARRLAEFVDDTEIGCPSGRCLMCGTSEPVRASVRKVMQHGGYSAAQRALWPRVVTDANALGNPKGCPRATLVEGHLCPACSAALGSGAVGPTARGKAVLAYVRTHIGAAEADRLDEMLSWDYGRPTLPAAPWVSDTCHSGPWSHLVSLFETLRKPLLVPAE